MMSSQVSHPAMPGLEAPSLASPHLQRLAYSPSSGSSSPAQLPYEARISLNPLQYPGGVQYPQAPYTANLNFNLINNAYKSKNVGEHSPSPSSTSGSPRTDETVEGTEPSSEGGQEGHLSGLEIMRRQAMEIPEVAKPGIMVRRDMGEMQEVSRNIGEMQEVRRDIGQMQEVRRNIGEMQEVRRDIGEMQEVGRDMGEIQHVRRDIVEIQEVQRDMGEMQEVQKDIGEMQEIQRDIGEMQEVRRNTGEILEVQEKVQQQEEVHEIHDIEDNTEELRIDEEMADEGNDSLERPIDDTFEEDKVEEVGEQGRHQFVGFQPYLQPRTGLEDGCSSLEKLQQVLNNRMFDNGVNKPTLKAEQREMGEAGERDFKFQLPEDEEGQVYQCHLCSFTGSTRKIFNEHVNTHYTFQCVKCDFETKAEGDYCQHLWGEHNLRPEDLEEAEVRAPRVNSQGKVKSFKCKQCEFVAITKLEFWKHGRGHIKPEKLLFCPKCIFVTEYKHHLEYHLRNHYGTKPFKCTHCNYSCVNKSMLNSHMKSHNNVYQYRCADCTYATKYCHSLKLHLKKYQHKPAMVLNQDGSPNPLPMVDVFGNRRGPKGKGGKAGSEDPLFPPSLLPQFPGLSPGFPHGLMHMMQMLPRQPLKEEDRGVSPPSMVIQDQLRCDKCDFATSSLEVHKNHLLLHATSERSALHTLLSSPLQQKSVRQEQREQEVFKLSSPLPPYHRPLPSFMERSKSPSQPPTLPTNHFLQNFPNLSFPNPFLGNLMPNPAIQALMEERKRQEREEQQQQQQQQLPSSPDSIQQSPNRREEAPLPPNKRLKTDIFASLYASRMSELEKKAGEHSPPLSGGVLDLSKENVEDVQPIGGGSHGSSSDNESGSNPRSNSSTPSLGGGSKSRRKGKAFKIVQQEDTNSEEEVGSSSMPSLIPIRPGTMSEQLMCQYCGISFQNSMMHSVHMSYHANTDPFKCKQCGDESSDALAFFLHIARKEHS